MPVYVGNLEYGYGRMKMSHMVADTLEELYDMADKIGIPRKWVQHLNDPQAIVHFDICKAKKLKAFQLGAIPMTDREIVVKFKLREKLGLAPL